ncbi:MAG TPA: hypothetical protein VHC92_03655 [Rhodanobacteraceae bacterium]|jgi:hypothetical protein|nr:hypothetical protein [Rhodanobacteraceae bacterium]
MRKIPAIIALACAAAFALAACNQQKEAAQQQAAAAPQVAAVPTNPNDKTAWKQYLVSVVTANMQGVKTNHPYMYFVPSGDDDATKSDRQNQLDNVKTVVARGVLPGNMMAFGGPDSKTTADLVVEAFKDAQAGSFKDVVVLFVGAPGDLDAVKQALASSGADVRFVEAK